MTSTRLAERSHSRQAAAPAGAAKSTVRDQILEVALEEFAKKGFQAASLSEIAVRVGVTAPLVLYHFGSKARLWREALEVFCADFTATVDRSIAEGAQSSGRDALRLVVRGLVLFFSTNGAAYRLMRDEGGMESGQREWSACSELRPAIDRMEAVYDRAVAEGAVRPLPFPTTFFMILGAVSCYWESRTLAARLFGSEAESEGSLDVYADQVVELCFDGLSASHTSSRQAVRPMLAALRAVVPPVNSGEGADLR